MDWFNISHAIIDCYRRVAIFQILDQSKFEFLCGSGILEPVVARARLIGRALSTLDVRERQIPVVSDFLGVFS